MRSLCNILSIVLLFALTIEAAWECGSDNDGFGGLSKGSSQFFVQLNCPALMNGINNCCINHDDCYDKQRGQKHCDDTFCQCSKNAVKDHPHCGKLRDVLCKAVRDHGAAAYAASGRRG
ncbi:unnamed protein product [Bursaphelenchus xylophilus]|uniref:(pine wood nematode) hypothetical protein n=1 Tax=Bursaphelenchus xylophilus TaxID=6326 RepID=A0A1I7S0Q3_BURXY|nr:unnamed protein product [Bursaphelenchus xylophilus]CAG9088247.1 unnamed protein product [Bursaphelenchus xylophilus]